jgi:hypothetical protein
MPSEPTIRRALEALATPRERFRSAVAGAVDEVAAFLDARRAPADGRTERTAHELGPFASGRLDAVRFASLFAETATLDPSALARVDRAHEALGRIAALGDEGFCVRVPDGGDLRAHVEHALADLGRAFGAARAVEHVRSGRYPSGEQEAYLDGFAFRHWNRAERQIAPPLVIDVAGGDLQAGGLAEYLDGNQKLVLVVRSPAPAAPLARLITPGMVVIQTADDAEFASFAESDGPAVLARVPEGCARFIHRPGRDASWERLRIEASPSDEPRAAIGCISVFQQREELAHLQALSIAPPAPEVPTAVTTPAEPAAFAAPAAVAASAIEAPAAVAATDPADRLAAWLLSQTDLAGT